MFSRPSLAESDVYHLLSNSRRREALEVLWDRPQPVSVRDLAEHIAAAESCETPAPRPLRRSVYNALHQTHLPKLDEFDLVEYDADRKLVRPSAHTRPVSRYMDNVTRAGVTWGEYYRALGIVGLFAVVASLSGLPAFGAVDPLVFATLSLATFAVSTCYQLVTAPGGLLARLR
jgi:hypothetical protein